MIVDFQRVAGRVRRVDKKLPSEQSVSLSLPTPPFKISKIEISKLEKLQGNLI